MMSGALYFQRHLAALVNEFALPLAVPDESAVPVAAASGILFASVARVTCFSTGIIHLSIHISN